LPSTMKGRSLRVATPSGWGHCHCVKGPGASSFQQAGREMVGRCPWMCRLSQRGRRGAAQSRGPVPRFRLSPIAHRHKNRCDRERRSRLCVQTATRSGSGLSRGRLRSAIPPGADGRCAGGSDPATRPSARWRDGAARTLLILVGQDARCDSERGIVCPPATTRGRKVAARDGFTLRNAPCMVITWRTLTPMAASRVLWPASAMHAWHGTGA